MSKFADYSDRRPSGRSRLEASTGLILRPALKEDLPQIARLSAARNATAPDEEEARLAKTLAKTLIQSTPTDQVLILAAVLNGEVIAYATAAYLSPSTDPGNDSTAPAGWYLTGVVVDPPHRRRGVGAKLTQARLDWIAQRAECAYYFANARNRVSIELHTPFGFQEVARAASIAGTTFEGGVGILLRADF